MNHWNPLYVHKKHYTDLELMSNNPDLSKNELHESSESVLCMFFRSYWLHCVPSLFSSVLMLWRQHPEIVLTLDCGREH